MLDETEISTGLEEIFRRPPTDAEVTFYTTEFATPRAAYLDAACSDAASASRTIVAFYQVFYDRVPEPAGFDFWTNLLQSGTVTIQELGTFFSTAAEFEANFAGLSNAEIVATLYAENLNREPDFAGLEFWTGQLNDGNISIADLGRFFATAQETTDLLEDPTKAFLVNAGEGNQDYEGSIFDETTSGSAFVTFEEEFNRTLLSLNTAEGAETVEGAPIVATGSPDEIDVLRLVGDADVRIDFTDPREQLEQVDLDGDGINEGETDFNVRDLFDISFFDIIDAHPRGAALLDPTDSANGFTGDLLFDGTGFDADGFGGSSGRLNGNIVLGGYGSDVIFTGIGNDFVSSGGLDDDIKTGRNADFIYQELSRLDDAFSGDDGEIDGGATFDDGTGQDSDWLLLEASDDEEPVTVSLQGAASSSVSLDDIDTVDELIAFLTSVLNASTGEDAGFISTRLGNDSASIQNIENVNASGNFYKFFDEAVTTTQTSAFVGFGAFINADEAAATSNGFAFFTDGGTVSVSAADIAAFNDGAGVQSVDDLRVLTQQAFDAAFPGQFVVPMATDEDPDGPVDTTGPIVRVDAIADNSFPTIPALNTTEDELARGQLLQDSDTEVFQSDLFFGDNRDFSPEEALYRVPGLSPGVTAQMVISGSSPEDNDGLSGDGNTDESGANILIAGYDDDIVYGLGGSDLLMGGDLEFLLTHQHNPNLFDTSDGTISVNAEDGVADDGRDTLIGGDGVDNLVWEADGGAYGGDNDLEAGGTGEAGDTLWLTTFSVGRTDDVDRSTDGSSSRFLAINGVGAVAEQDLTGSGEASDELDALNEVTADLVLRFDLGVGAGTDYQGNGNDLAFRGDLAGADRAGTADQTNYREGSEASVVVDVENVNVSGYGAIDYLAAGEGTSDGTDLVFENRQNYRGVNSNVDLRGIDADPGVSTGGEGAGGDSLVATITIDTEGTPLLSGLDIFYSQPGGGFSNISVELFGGAPVEARNASQIASEINAELGGLGVVATVISGSQIRLVVPPTPGGATPFNINLNSPSDLSLTTGTTTTFDSAALITDSDYFTDRLIAEFNQGSSQADGSAIANLLYQASESFEDGTPANVIGTGVGNVAYENRLFASFGDDVLEGRGGDDWLEGREGDDIFIVSTNDGDGDTTGSAPNDMMFGNTVNGDNVNIIARRLDADEDGLLDGTVGGTVIGNDFRPGAPGTTTATIVTVELQPIGAFNVENGPDDWSTFISLTFTLVDGTEIVAAVGPGLPFATDVAAALQAELPAGFTVTAGEASEDESNSEVDVDPGQIDAVFISYDPEVTGVVGDPVAQFTTPGGQNSGFSLQTEVEVQEIPTPGDQEDDEIVFRSYQNRLDDESVPDRQVSLGYEAYAEDLVVGVQDGTTKLVEGQEYRILLDDLKEGDLVTIKLNGKEYSRVVEFEDDPTGGDRETDDFENDDNISETTYAFLLDFAEQINAEIARDPNGRDGRIAVSVDLLDGSPAGDTGALVIREKELDKDFKGGTNYFGAEQVFLQFPMVTVENRSGGDAPTYVIKETSDTSVVIYDYDFFDETTDGLNQGVGVNEQRGEAIDDRFITFEDTTGINRAILQNAFDDGETIEGLDIVAFDTTSGTDFGEDVFNAGDLVETLIQTAVTTTQSVFLTEDDGVNQPGNEFFTIGDGVSLSAAEYDALSSGSGTGEATDTNYAGLHGDDLLIGGDGTDTILGRTGDDRIIASRTATNSSTDREFLNGGVNVVVDANGVVQEAGTIAGLPDSRGVTSGLLQVEDYEDLEDGDELIRFIDTLTLNEGRGLTSNEDDETFAEGSLFAITINGASEDFSLDGSVTVDEEPDGVIDHYIDFTNFEVVRTLSNTEADTLAFSAAITGLSYDNSGNMGTVNFDGLADDVAMILGVETVTGTDDVDTLIGGTQDETLSGGLGDDTLAGNGGDDILNGGEGDDTFFELDLDLADVLDGEGDGDGSFDEMGDFSDDGDDVFNGGAGSDVFHVVLDEDGGENAFNGEAGDDVFNLDGNEEAVIDVLFDASLCAFIGTDSIDTDGDDDITDPEADLSELLDGDAPTGTIAGGEGTDDVINLTNFFNIANETPALLSVDDDADSDDEDSDDDGDETITLDITVLGLDDCDKLTSERVTVTVSADAIDGDTDGDDDGEIAAAIAAALEAAGFTAAVSGGDVAITDFEGGDIETVTGIVINDVDVTDADNDTGLEIDATFGTGPSGIVDMQSIVVTGVETLDTRGGTFVISEETFAGNTDIQIIGGGQMIVVDGDGDGEISSGLTAANFVDPLEVVFVGEDAAETITGTSGDDLILASGGDDLVNAGAGNDQVLGGAGNDTLNGETGLDTIDGGEGDDTINGGDETAADDVANIQPDMDADVTETAVVTLSVDGLIEAGDEISLSIGGETAGFTVTTETDVNAIAGALATQIELELGMSVSAVAVGDTITITTTDPEVDITLEDFEFDEADGGVTDGGVVSAVLVNDGDTVGVIDSGDTLIGGEGNDTINGGAGSDTIKGGEDDDTIDAGADNDTVLGGSGDDNILGGDGEDELFGDLGTFDPAAPGNDTIDGGDGDDTIWGEAGDDDISGGDGDDVLLGGAGTDTIDAGDDDDNDVIVFQSAGVSNIGGADTVLNFGIDEDSDDDGDDGEFEDVIDITGTGVISVDSVSQSTGDFFVSGEELDTDDDTQFIFRESGGTTQVIVQVGGANGMVDGSDLVFFLDSIELEDIAAAAGDLDTMDEDEIDEADVAEIFQLGVMVEVMEA